MPTIIMDLDGTMTHEDSSVPYPQITPRQDVIAKLREYKEQGFTIAVYTARNMKTHARSVGAINAKTLPIIIDWLRQHDVPFDEIYVGKPWPESDGFYVDDRAIRPDEFLTLSHGDIMKLTGRLGR